MIKTDFNSLFKEFEEEVRGIEGDVAPFVVGFLNSKVPHYNWVGIYMIEGSDLVLSAYSGPKETEHTRVNYPPLKE